MTKKSEILHFIAKMINDEQNRFSKLKLDIINTGLAKSQTGKESLEILTLIYESRREMLDNMYKEIQSM